MLNGVTFGETGGPFGPMIAAFCLALKNGPARNVAHKVTARRAICKIERGFLRVSAVNLSWVEKRAASSGGLHTISGGTSLRTREMGRVGIEPTT